MNSPMVQQMMSNPETGSEGRVSTLIVLTDGLGCWYVNVERTLSSDSKDLPKRRLILNTSTYNFQIHSFYGFPASKICIFCSTFPWYILKTVGYAAWLWNPQLLVAQGHVARHGADESTAKWANGTTSRDCKDAGRSRIASTVLTQLGLLTLGWEWHPKHHPQ